MLIIGPEEREARRAIEASEEAVEALKQSVKEAAVVTDNLMIVNDIVESYEDLINSLREVYKMSGKLSSEDALPSVVQCYIRGDVHDQDKTGRTMRLAEVLGTFYGLARDEGIGTEDSTELCEFDITLKADLEPHSRWESGYVVSLTVTLKVAPE
jgi:hypothetical protein